MHSSISRQPVSALLCFDGVIFMEKGEFFTESLSPQVHCTSKFPHTLLTAVLCFRLLWQIHFDGKKGTFLSASYLC